MADIASILSRVKRPTASVTLCLDADLFGEYQALDAQLRAAAPGQSLAGNPEADDLLAQMDALREQMVDSEVTFRFQALPALDFANIRSRRPAKAEGQSDEEFVSAFHGWVCEVVAAACLDPVMTADQAAELAAALADPQWRQLQDAAWVVNAERQEIPFSEIASVLTRNSAGKSRQPEPPENPDHGSLAGNPSSEPESSTTETGSSGGSPRRSRSGRTKTATS